MTGDFSADKMKSVDRMANKWSDFHNAYKAQLEDLLVDRFKLHDHHKKLNSITINIELTN